MRSGVLALLACSAACAKIEPAYDFEPQVSVVENGFERRVIGPNYEMRFHGGEQNDFHLPESLLVGPSAGAIETLSTDPSCLLEHHVGFGLFPALVAAPGGGLNNRLRVTMGDITTNDDGPFVAQINTSFSAEYDCEQPHAFRANSTFTFFPNGRIVRHDFDVQAIEMDVDSTGQAFPCGCSQDGFDGSYVFTSFWAFENGGTTVDAGNNPIDNVRDVPGACTVYNTHAVGVQYAPQISRVLPNNNASAHVLDFQTGGMLTTDVAEAFSAIQIVDGDAAQCNQVLQGLAEPAIRIQGDDTMDQLNAANQDGIYDDPQQPREGSIEISVVGNDIMPAGWAFTTELETDIVKITRNPSSSVDPVAYVQRFEPNMNRFLIVFNDSMGPGVTYTIEPL